jgi:arylsulfatase A-like enzyme
MMVNYPGVTPTNQRSAAPVIIEDLFPSILEMAGVREIPENDGVSFIPILADPDLDRSQRPLFWHYPNFYHLPPYSSVRLGNDKLIYWHITQQLELFDLSTDLSEQNNLAAQRPKKTREFALLLTNHLRKTGALMPIDRVTGKAIPYPSQIIQ